VNIFVCDTDPHLAARALPDKLVVKMPLESAQIACTILHKHGLPAEYRPTHASHPAVLWAGESAPNFRWLLDHGLALCEEYTRRYGKRHASQQVLESVLSRPVRFAHKTLTPFVQCMPEEFRSPNPIESYRAFLRNKPYKLSWKAPASRPAWW
jgi:hypothetical protein